jgi:Domain of unknown function (DUF4276)
MIFIEVLVEGSSDAPVVREVLQRQFHLHEKINFRIHPHKGKGALPLNPLGKPQMQQQGLLDQLPAKLMGFGSYLPDDAFVLVLVDADDEPCDKLLLQLQTMLAKLPNPPRVLFRIVIEEVESWFIADYEAVKKAYPKAKVAALKKIKPDAICGAWEKLAEALGQDVGKWPASGKFKTDCAMAISPHLNLDEPKSPSLRKLIQGVERELKNKKIKKHP